MLAAENRGAGPAPQYSAANMAPSIPQPGLDARGALRFGTISIGKSDNVAEPFSRGM